MTEKGLLQIVPTFMFPNDISKDWTSVTSAGAYKSWSFDKLHNISNHA